MDPLLMAQALIQVIDVAGTAYVAIEKGLTEEQRKEIRKEAKNSRGLWELSKLHRDPS
jgi:hypothetical protein